MKSSTIEDVKSLNELTQCIENAMRKVNTKRETDLCHYIPVKEGHIHHFAFKKLKHANPTELKQMLAKHILDVETPKNVPPKLRPSVKKEAALTLKSSQIDQLLMFLKNGTEFEGSKELIDMLSPQHTLAQVQKLMIDMVRTKDIDEGLWKTYVRMVEEERSTSK